MFTREYYNQNLRDTARSLRRNMTPAENEIWYKCLSKMKPRVHRQRSMGRFIADFYIPKAKLIIEIDGGIHTKEKVAAKDRERTLFFKSFGIEELRFTNNEVFLSFEKVCQSIKQTVFDRLQKVR